MRIIAVLFCALACLSADSEWDLEVAWESGSPGDSGHWYGLIEDAAILPSGGVVALDNGSQQLALLGITGDVIQVTGKQGRGPGEFVNPVSMEVDHGSRVFVLDTQVGRISVFEAREERLTYGDSWIPPISLVDFCVLGDRIIGLSSGAADTGPGLVLHELTWGQMSVTRTFGPPVEESRERSQLALGNGRLFCSESQNLIVFLPDFYPEVHAFRHDGSHAWTTQLPGYEPVTIEAGPGWVRYSAESGYHDTGATLSSSGNRLVVQWARVRRGMPREETRTVTTALLSLSTGELWEVREELPRLAFGGAAGFVGYTNAPYPKVTRYREVER